MSKCTYSLRMRLFPFPVLPRVESSALIAGAEVRSTGGVLSSRRISPIYAINGFSRAPQSPPPPTIDDRFAVVLIIATRPRRETTEKRATRHRIRRSIYARDVALVRESYYRVTHAFPRDAALFSCTPNHRPPRSVVRAGAGHVVAAAGERSGESRGMISLATNLSPTGRERSTRKLREQGRKREPDFDVVLVITKERERERERGGRDKENWARIDRRRG